MLQQLRKKVKKLFTKTHKSLLFNDTLFGDKTMHTIMNTTIEEVIDWVTVSDSYKTFNPIVITQLMNEDAPIHRYKVTPILERLSDTSYTLMILQNDVGGRTFNLVKQIINIPVHEANIFDVYLPVELVLDGTDNRFTYYGLNLLDPEFKDKVTVNDLPANTLNMTYKELKC